MFGLIHGGGGRLPAAAEVEAEFRAVARDEFHAAVTHAILQFGRRTEDLAEPGDFRGDRIRDPPQSRGQRIGNR